MLNKLHSMDVLCNQVTDALRTFGPVHRLYTPEGGTRITSIGQIQDGKNYVASNKTRFRKLNYNDIVDLRSKERMYKRNCSVSPSRNKPNKFQFLGRSTLTKLDKPRQISLIRNGDQTCQYVQLLLTKRNTINWSVTRAPPPLLLLWGGGRGVVDKQQRFRVLRRARAMTRGAGAGAGCGDAHTISRPSQ